MQLSCEHCLWWQHESEGIETQTGLNYDYGRCHRFPPREEDFPLLLRNSFCGEFTPRTYASVARLAGAQLSTADELEEAPPREIRSARPAVKSGELLDGEIAATIAAAVAMVIDTPHRILAVEPVKPQGFGPWPLGAVLNTWAIEGRVHHFASHRIR